MQHRERAWRAWPPYAKRGHAARALALPPYAHATHSQEIAGHIKKSFQDAYACVRARSHTSLTRAPRCRLILHSACTRVRALSLSARRRGNWHVFCGRNVASCVTHEAGKFIYFYLGQTGFIIFATA